MTAEAATREAVAGTRPREAAARWTGLAVPAVLVVLAFAAPPVLGWSVQHHVGDVTPLLSIWAPHVGPGTVPALAVGALVVARGARVAERAPWGLVLLAAFAVSLAWILSLAAVDGVHGIARVLGSPREYLRPARAVTDVGAALHGFVGRIPLTSPDRWPSHVAGHPPGALLFFVLLVRLGLGSSLAAGVVVVVLAATVPVAVLVALRRLGAEAAARRAAPFLAVGPSAVWLGVTADAMFAAVAAWGLCCLAVAATARTRAARFLVAAAAGLLLGACVLLSYGLVLLGVLALAVLLVARAWTVLPVAAGAALALVVATAAAGFAWWEAYPVLLERYHAGVARLRPYGYWVWGNLAVLAVSAGPVVGAGVATAAVRRRAGRLTAGDRAVVLLVAAAALTLLLADASGLSKSEVERIWLPFVPWLVVGAALLPSRWRRLGIAGGVLVGLAVEHLLRTAW